MEKNEKKREKIVDYNRYYYIPVTSKFVEYKGIPFIFKERWKYRMW